MSRSLSLPALLLGIVLVGCDSATKGAITAPNGPVAPTPDIAQVTVGTLTGETFVGTELKVDGKCDAEGGGTFRFFVSGVAEGPYPGIFKEDGVFTLAGGTGTFSSQFTIQSTTIITGKKFSDFPVFGSCDGTIVKLTGQAGYVADGAGVKDQGVASVELFQDARTGQFVFNEVFTSLVDEALIVILEPPAAENPVGTKHTVVATVLAAPTFKPVKGATVVFQVSSPSGFSVQGKCLTDETGRCEFTYQGPQDPDVHLIEGCAHYPGIRSGCGNATKVFFLPASTPGQVTGGGHILHAGMVHGVSFGFNAQFSEERGHHGRGVVVDHTSGRQIKIIDVTHLLIVGTHATIRGNAEVDGMPTRYTMDVDDLGESGIGRDTFKIETESGYLAAGVLSGGNIQIHDNVLAERR